MDETLPKTCIVGAGTSGLICAKVMLQRGLPFDCLEKGSKIGGLWRFGNDNGMSGIYRSLHINTSKRVMELSDFPFPEHMAEYPGNTEIIEYFESYAEHFGVIPHISFRTELTAARRLEDGCWQVDLLGPAGAETRYYDVLIVANGHHWDPRMVEFPGHFDGRQLHAHDYISATEPIDLRGKKVVVVGSGNSAMDIASELGQGHREGRGPSRVILSQRSGVWVTPKVLGNIPQDRALRHPMKKPGLWECFKRRFIPKAVRITLFNFIAETWLRLIVGDPQRVGLKQPADRYSQRHGTVSQDVHARLIHGDITPRGNIRELRGREVIFEDGSVESADVIIQCTGYHISFPFFDPALVSAPDNDIALWQRIYDPRFDNLMFIALVQPICAMMPIAELQSNFVADYLTGAYQLPGREQMERERYQYHEGMKSEFTPSLSHTIEINCEEYSYHLYREWERGSKRARADGNPLPLAATACNRENDKAQSAA
jgi:cation diffusion facilitator CzcD-associated flavoprotein CzcO